MPILNQSRRFKKLPSEILRIEDEYTSYCFDEACEYILSQLDEEKKPIFLEDRKEAKEKAKNNGARAFLKRALLKREVEQ